MSVIQEIKGRIDIVEVVSEYVTLQKSGRNFRAICPFHAEKTPSFFIFPERQSWHCFGGCATGGDVFSFLMKKESIDFGEALRILAQRAGISLAPRQESEAADREIERLRQINEAAAQYYHHLLLNSTPAEVGRRYLERRGILPKTIEDFRLGFSPEGWDGLLQHLAKSSFGEEELVAAGVALKGEGKVYDRFRGRLMFPICNEQGRVVGFGARALDDSTPKYLNSPQTAIFDKSGLLYALDRAKVVIRQKNLAIIVEGYMDVLAAHQNGIGNVVASMGTALSEKQVALLKRLTKNLALALDADAAGAEATLRGLEVATAAFDKTITVFDRTMPVGLWRGLVRHQEALDGEIKVIALPQGKDPDDVIREGVAEWHRLVETALPLVDYVFDTMASKLDITKPKDKSTLVKQLGPLVNEMQDPVQRAHYVQKLARLAQVDERVLESSLEKRHRSGQRGRVRAKQTTPVPLPSGDPLEEYCLSLLLQHPELKAITGELEPEYFEYSENKELFLIWRDAGDTEVLTDSLDLGLREHLTSLLARPLPPLGEEERGAAFGDCFRRLRERRLRRLKLREEVLIFEAEALGDVGEVSQLQERGMEVNAQLRRIFIERAEAIAGRRTKGDR